MAVFIHAKNDYFSHLVTRPNTRRKMRLAGVCEKALRTYGRTDGRTEGRTDTPSYRDATAHLKNKAEYSV